MWQEEEVIWGKVKLTVNTVFLFNLWWKGLISNQWGTRHECCVTLSWIVKRYESLQGLKEPVCNRSSKSLRSMWREKWNSSCLSPFPQIVYNCSAGLNCFSKPVQEWSNVSVFADPQTTNNICHIVQHSVIVERMFALRAALLLTSGISQRLSFQLNQGLLTGSLLFRINAEANTMILIMTQRFQHHLLRVK